MKRFALGALLLLSFALLILVALGARRYGGLAHPCQLATSPPHRLPQPPPL